MVPGSASNSGGALHLRQDAHAPVSRSSARRHPAIAQAPPIAADQILRLHEGLGRDLLYRYRLLPEPRFEYVSGSCTAMTGYTPEEHYADPDLAVRMVHPEDLRLLQSIPQGGGGRNPMILRWVRRDGSIIWTEHRTRTMVDDSGEPVIVEGIARDVTDVVRAGEVVRAARTAMLDFVDLAPGLGVVVDSMGRVSQANARFCDLTGWAAEEVMGRDWSTLGERLTNRAEVVAPLLLRDGQSHIVRWTQMVMKDVGGYPTGTAMLGEDLTAAGDLALVSAALEAAVAQSGESIVVTDPQARILSVNPAFERATGYRSEEVLGKNPRVLQSGHQSAAFYRVMWMTLTRGRTWRGELVNRRRDGALLIEEASITPVQDGEGTVIAYVAVKRDVTRQRQLRASLDDVQHRREMLANALGKLTTRETIEETCDDIAGVLCELPEAVAGAVALFDGGRVARMAGMRSTIPINTEGGSFLPSAVSDRILEHGEQGPWIEPLVADSTSPGVGDAADAGILAVMIVPLRVDGRVLGALLIGGSDSSGADILPQVPAANQVAAVARSLLAPHVATQIARTQARERIRRIIDAKAFRTLFQPIVDLYSGRALGFEALTRFDDMVPPIARFEEASSCGMGCDLELATIKAAIEAAGELATEAILSLNISPEVILAGGDLRQILEGQPRAIVLELTERAEVADYGALVEALAALGPGIRIAVDDAGAGNANLQHLVLLRPDFVKLDIGLTRGIDSDLTRQALIIGLREYARVSGRALIAKGIETELERNTLIELSVRFGQGYLLGAPAPAEAWHHIGIEGPDAFAADTASTPWHDPNPAGRWRRGERHR